MSHSCNDTSKNSVGSTVYIAINTLASSCHVHACVRKCLTKKCNAYRGMTLCPARALSRPTPHANRDAQDQSVCRRHAYTPSTRITRVIPSRRTIPLLPNHGSQQTKRKIQRCDQMRPLLLCSSEKPTQETEEEQIGCDLVTHAIHAYTDTHRFQCTTRGPN